jgi:hypothetical protein
LKIETPDKKAVFKKPFVFIRRKALLQPEFNKGQVFGDYDRDARPCVFTTTIVD